MSLDILLKHAGLRKSDLAKRLGVSNNCVSKWKGRPPKYAAAYLLLLIEYNKLIPTPKI